MKARYGDDEETRVGHGRGAQKWIQEGSDRALQYVDRDCPHEEIEFNGGVEFESGCLVFHVNCRACGRSGSTTVAPDDVLW